jgi:hypothetical protein
MYPAELMFAKRNNKLEGKFQWNKKRRTLFTIILDRDDIN